MLRRRDNLPLARGGRSPTPPRRQIDMPNDANCALNCVWVLGGLCLLGIGYLHCSSNSAHARLRCIEDVCTLTRNGPSFSDALEIKFLRENLVKGEVGQLDKDANLITGKRANRRPKRGTPVTLSLTWKDGETQSMTTVPLTTYDLGRKTPKRRVSQVSAYVKGQRDDLDIDESKWITGIGILCFVFGGLLVSMRTLVGAILPTAPSRRARVAPRKFFT